MFTKIRKSIFFFELFPATVELLRQRAAEFQLFDFLSPAWIQDLIQAYGLWVLFSVVLFECMGIPLPGEIALITTALYSGSTHRIGIFTVVLVAAAAGILGYSLAYLIG